MLMKRFNEEEEGFFDDDDEGDGVDEMFDDDNEYYIPSETLSSIHELEMFEMELDRKIMDQAIQIASGNFFWKFKSNKRKQRSIIENYVFLKKTFKEDEEEKNADL